MMRAEKIMTLLVVLSTAGCNSHSDEALQLEGPYLGQEPPGRTPVEFAPGVVSTSGWEYGGTFSPDLNEFYFLREATGDAASPQEFVVARQEDNHWSLAVVSPRVGQPFISTDGATMYLGKRFMARVEDGWSDVKDLGPPFDDLSIMRMTVSANGTYVFDEPGMPDGDGVIRYSRLSGNEYDEPKPMPKEINTGSFNAHPFIAPDESYIIWDGRRPGGFGSSDLFISFRMPDGSWSEAMNMGDKINTAAWEAGASVTPDGKYLFFNRNVGSDAYENVDIFWVDAQVIVDLRPSG